MKTRILLGLTVLAFAGGTARAQVDPTCRLQAKTDYANCKADCRETFQAAKDSCRNCDHSFAEGCRASRAICEDPFQQTLETCTDGCRTTLDGDKADCTTAYNDCINNGGDPTQCAADRDTCVDAAQVKAFICRDTCREDATVRAGIKACAETFRGCMRQCPPAS
jgi:hypothetical protein